MTTTPAPGEPGNQTPLDALYWARRDREGVRALIAEAEALTKVRFGGDSDLVRRLAAALAASLPRPDAALDGRTCSYCVKRPATAVDDDLDAICSECAEPAPRDAETTEEWEYGWIATFDNGDVYDERPLPSLIVARQAARALTAVEAKRIGPPRDALTFTVSRRRPATAPGAWEQVPPAHEEADTARECSNDRHHGYNTGYCGDCAKEADQ